MKLPASVRHQLLSLKKTPLLFHGTGHHDYAKQLDEIPASIQTGLVMLTPCPDLAFMDAAREARGAPDQGAIMALDANWLRKDYDSFETFERDGRRVYIEHGLPSVSLYLAGVLQIGALVGPGSPDLPPPLSPHEVFETSTCQRLLLGFDRVRKRLLDNVGADDGAERKLLSCLADLVTDVTSPPCRWPIIDPASPRGLRP